MAAFLSFSRILALIAFVASAIVLEIHGRVVSVDGVALPGVSVFSPPTDKTSTGPDGSFVLTKPGEVIRFSLQGYRPVTKTRDQLNLDSRIVLHKDQHAVWSPPACGTSAPSIRGEFMGFSIPPDAKVERNVYDDYTTISIQYKQYEMRLGWGPAYSWGLPTLASYYDGLVQLEERDIDHLPGTINTEYRGVRSNGTYWRWVGRIGESVSYDQVDKEAVAYYDRIIDSLCWLRPYWR